MNEDSITAFAIQEIKKVFLPPGLFLDLQLSAGLSIEALKETLKSYSLTAAVKEELADRNYDNYIQRRLRKKQNIIASEYLGTNTLLDLLHHKSGKRFKERQITVTMKDIFDSLQDFDGDVDELEIELSNQMENKILV
jgi:hypothetical protein